MTEDRLKEQAEQDDRLMSIGRFSALTRLSLKALRLYDKLGLLRPTWTDPANGYRYYDSKQVDTARLISRLRQVDMPLERIATVVAMEGADAARELRTYWREVEDSQTAKRSLTRYLEQTLLGEGVNMHKVETRSVEEQQVMTIERRLTAPELPQFIGSSGEEIYAYLADNDAGEVGDMFVIYHDEVLEDTEGAVEVCVPFTGQVAPQGAMRVRLEPARSEAYTRIAKREIEFPEILKAYDSVEQWMSSKGKQMTGSPREVYFADWDAIGDDDPACDIAWPYQG